MKESLRLSVNGAKAAVFVVLYAWAGFPAPLGGFATAALAAPDGPVVEVEADRVLIEEVTRLLDLDRLVAVMSQEAVAQAGEDLGAIPPEQQKAWQANIARINDPERLKRLLAAELSAALGRADAALIRQALQFYRTEFGARVVRLELSARMAMIPADGREAAIEAAGQAAETGSLRLEQIDRLMILSEVVDANVAGSLNAIIASSRGFSDASGIDLPPSDVTAEAWAQEPQIRDDIAQWVQAMLFLAYSPLSEAEVEEVISFVGSRGALELANALDTAFDGIFARIAYETGVMSAGQLSEADL